MTNIKSFDKFLADSLPITHDILLAEQLTVHPCVTKVILSGSRGLAGNSRPDSDIDLSLVVDSSGLPNDERSREALLQEITQTTLSNWTGKIELDIAVILDISNCGLLCLDQTYYNGDFCPIERKDCFGIYKLQKGFTGYVPPGILDIRRIYPLLTIWTREG